MKVHEIIPGRLYQRGLFGKLTRREKSRELSRLGVGCVVALAGPIDDDLDALLGSRYVYLPIPDGAKLDENSLLENADEVGGWMEDGVGVLTHCRAGRNRSSLFSALLAVRILGCSGEQAVALLRNNRKNSLANEHFVNFLNGVVGHDRQKGYVLREGLV